MAINLKKQTAVFASMAIGTFTSLGSPAFATGNFTVTNCGSSGSGSFLQAMNDLNTAGSGTVTFDSNLNCEEITVDDTFLLTGDTSIVGPVNGDVKLLVTNSNYWVSLFQGEDIFDFAISNLDIETAGAGLLFMRSATSGSSNISLNHITFNSPYGPAVELTDANTGRTHPFEVEITNSEFTGLDSAYGRQIYADYNLSIEDTKFVGNVLSEGSLVSAGENIVLNNVEFTNNDAGFNPGSLVYAAGSIAATNVSISDSDGFNAPFASMSGISLNQVSIDSSNFNGPSSTAGSINIESSSFTNSNYSGAAFSGNDVTSINSTFAENYLGEGETFFSTYTLKFYQNTFVRNVTPSGSWDRLTNANYAEFSGNLFVTDTDRTIYCETNFDNGGMYDNGGNIFSSIPTQCGYSAITTDTTAGRSALISNDNLALSELTQLENKTYGYIPNSDSPLVDYYSAQDLNDSDFAFSKDQTGIESRPSGEKYDVGSIEVVVEEVYELPLVLKKTALFAPLSAKLKPRVKAALREFVANLPKDLAKPKVFVKGYVQPNSFKSNNRALSASRAKAIATFLRKIGLKAEYKLLVAGEAKTKSYKARKVLIKVRYND